MILSRVDIKIEDAVISDHLPILFFMSFDGNTPSESSLPRSSEKFSSKYELLGAIQDMKSLISHLDVSIFNNNCSNVSNSIAPVTGRMRRETYRSICKL